MPSADTSPPRHRAAIRFSAILLALAATLVIVARIGYWRMFSYFSPYDDEGCVLITIKSFMDGHPLYDEVFSMYGPLPVLLKWLIFAMAGVPVGHDVGRLIALGYWLAAAAFSGAAAWRLTRSVVGGWAAALFVFHGLGPIVFGPGHPQDLCAVLLAVGVLLATWVGPSANHRRSAILAGLGVVAGCLAMTKINVFVFLMMALGAAALAFMARTRRVAALMLIGAVALLAAPSVLMRTLLDRPAVSAYALHVTLALLPVLMLGFGRRARPLLRWTDCAWIGAGLMGAVVMVTAIVLWRGTSWRGLIDGVLLIPLRAGVQFISATGAFDHRWPVPLAFSALALGWLALDRSGGAVRTIPSSLSAALRIAYGGYFLWNQLSLPSYDQLLAFAVPAAVLVLMPLDSAERPAGDAFGRLFLALLAVTEALWGYPVAGSQRAFSTFLSVLILVIAVADGCRDLAAVCSQWVPRSSRIAGHLVQAGVVAALLLVARSESALAEAMYQHGRPLGLPGAQAIRLSASEVDSFQTLAAQLHNLPDSFFTLPGMYSLYFWSEQESPTALNLTNWMYMLDDRQQERIVAALEARPNIRLVYNPLLVRFWMEGKPLPSTPLLRYLDANFVPVMKSGTMEIWARQPTPATPPSTPLLPIKPSYL